MSRGIVSSTWLAIPSIHQVSIQITSINCYYMKSSYWIEQLGVSIVSLELDCKTVVDGILDLSSTHSNFGAILRSYKAIMSNMPNLRINFIKRQTDRVVHHSPKASILYDSRQFFYCIGYCIEPAILNEMS